MFSVDFLALGLGCCVDYNYYLLFDGVDYCLIEGPKARYEAPRLPFTPVRVVLAAIDCEWFLPLALDSPRPFMGFRGES